MPEIGPPVDWSPLKRGGTNFQTRKLVPIDGDTVMFKATRGALAFYSFFLLFGIVPSGIGFWQLMTWGFVWKAEVILPFCFGGVFSFIGLLLLGFGVRPIVFDRCRDYFWKGRKDPDAVWDQRELKHFADLKDLYGLQIVSESVKSDKGSFMSYELNLVMDDGSRINVVDHGNREKLVADAEALAEFLGIPLLSR